MYATIRCCALLLCFAQISFADVWIRDSWNGQAVNASVDLIRIKPSALSSEQTQQIRSGHWLDSAFIRQGKVIRHQGQQIQLQATDEIQLMHITHEAYWPMRTWIEPFQNTELTTIWLQAQHQQRCPAATICGFVVNTDDFSALKNVHVGLFEHEAKTDGAGFFSVPLMDSTEAELIVTKTGFRSKRLLMTPDQSGMHVIIELSTGDGIESKNLRHPLLHMPQGHVDRQWQLDKLQQQATLFDGQLRERAGGAVYIQPPLSIRIGFDNAGGYCCGNGCATSQVFSLEYYVQRGLDNEWIASWDSDSLKAGTIPFRSYGAWHVMNSPYAGYDICAGPCCQAFENTGFNSAIAAANATRGLMLELNGDLARSEYSAENNSWNDPNDGLNCSNSDLSCGDGFVGSPATGWSCLYDESEGRGCFGHGRGMSQWGTQFRALNGDNWADIVDHYYNASGNPAGTRSQYASTPVRLQNVISDPSQVMSGETIQLQYTVFNGSDIAASFGPIMLGASLLSATESYSDPMNDNSHVLDLAGLQDLNRDFVVAEEVLPGLYDLAVAVWLDVNNDAQISSVDWVLDVQRYTAAVEVISDNDVIFLDSFDSAQQ